MGKRIIALVISFLFGLFSAPAILSNADDFTPSVTAFDDQKTEIIELKPAPRQVFARGDIQNIQTQNTVAQSLQTQTTTTVKTTPTAPNAAATQPALPASYISILGRNIEVVDVADTLVDAGGHVNRYGNKFFYGHNSGAVFGGLPSLGTGSVFSVTMNGVTVKYQVVLAVVFEKNIETGKLQLGGEGNYMGAVARARHMGQQYGISLMTCYGTSLGHGDATHRYVIFANQI